MRGFGEIARLCAVGRPDIGVVTAVAPAHTERVGGIDGVARAKAELSRRCRRRHRVLNADDERVAAMAGSHRGRGAHVRSTRRRRRAHQRRSCSTTRRGPVRPSRTPWGTSHGRARRQRRAHGGRTPPPRSPSPASSASTSTPPPPRWRGAALSRDADAARHARRPAALRDQRRLQRQPDLDGRRARRARAPSTPSAGSRCSA